MFFFFVAFWMEFFVLAHQDANFIQEAEIYKRKKKEEKVRLLQGTCGVIDL